MKNKETYKDYYIYTDDIINLLLFENNILQKKIKKEKLTQREQIFDNLIVSPSLILNHMIKLSNRRDSDKNYV